MKFNKGLIAVLTVSFVFIVLGLAGPATVYAYINPVTVNFGTADYFAVLGGSTVTNTGGSAVTGDLGVSPGDAVTGFPPGIVTGTQHKADAVALQAKNDLATAYDDAAGRACDANLTGQDLGGMTLTHGVYCFDASAQLTGTLTLNAEGDSNAVFIFKIGTTLTTASDSVVALTNSGQNCHVFWQVGSSATIGTNSTFKGNILALTSATLTTGANVTGRVLARNGAVTLDTNAVTKAICADAAATLTVTKTVTNDNGGLKTVSDFPLFIDGMSVISEVASTTSVGLHTVSETIDSGYTATIGGDCAADGTITLAPGDVKTCTITNNDKAATLIVKKVMVNDNGGALNATNFSFSVNAGVAQVFEADGQNNVIVSAGTYTVTEPAVAGYLTSYDNCSGLVIPNGGSATCTITNNDIAPQLIVTKTVINDNNGAVTTFPLFIDGFGVISGVASTTSIGSHTVSETSNPGYAATIGGHCAADGTITLALGDIKTCTITNDDIAPAAVPTATGAIISYSSVPPLIDVVKVPSPLALPAGPGAVTYTYTLRNIGTVPVTGITMVGDTCNPINLISGDTDADAKLDVNETWTYRCSTTLSVTHTNTITATGWANGISAVDIASATVVVGSSVTPPLIHITKTPNPLALSAEGGMVTYTKRITNPGTAALSNVRVTDDKCGPVKYISGDTNGNSKLDTIETWNYTCRTNLAETTTNTAIAEGEANGLSARDFAIATVVVAAAGQVVPKAAVTVVPGLPDAGLTPVETNIFWNIIIPAGFLLLASILLAVIIKKRTI